MGPKDTPFEGGVFPAVLTFVRPPPAVRAPTPLTPAACPAPSRPRQPSDYPLSPFKMKFDPPLFHPNSKC